MQRNKQDALMKGSKRLGKVELNADRNQQMIQPSRQDGSRPGSIFRILRWDQTSVNLQWALQKASRGVS